MKRAAAIAGIDFKAIVDSGLKQVTARRVGPMRLA
jgi:hypothetical protein